MPRKKKLVDEMKEMQEKQVVMNTPVPDEVPSEDKPKRGRKPKAPVEQDKAPGDTPKKKTITSTIKAEDISDSYSGIYTVTAKLLNLRKGPGMDYPILTVIRKGALVSNSGYFTKVGDAVWLYVTYTEDKTNTVYTGYCNAEFLKK